VVYFPLITISNRHVAKTLVKYRLSKISKNDIYFLVDTSDSVSEINLMKSLEWKMLRND